MDRRLQRALADFLEFGLDAAELYAAISRTGQTFQLLLAAREVINQQQGDFAPQTTYDRRSSSRSSATPTTPASPLLSEYLYAASPSTRSRTSARSSAASTLTTGHDYSYAYADSPSTRSSYGATTPSPPPPYEDYARSSSSSTRSTSTTTSRPYQPLASTAAPASPQMVTTQQVAYRASTAASPLSSEYSYTSSSSTRSTATSRSYRSLASTAAPASPRIETTQQAALQSSNASVYIRSSHARSTGRADPAPRPIPIQRPAAPVARAPPPPAAAPHHWQDSSTALVRTGRAGSGVSRQAVSLALVDEQVDRLGNHTGGELYAHWLPYDLPHDCLDGLKDWWNKAGMGGITPALRRADDPEQIEDAYLFTLPTRALAVQAVQDYRAKHKVQWCLWRKPYTPVVTLGLPGTSTTLLRVTRIPGCLVTGEFWYYIERTFPAVGRLPASDPDLLKQLRRGYPGANRSPNYNVYILLPGEFSVARDTVETSIPGGVHPYYKPIKSKTLTYLMTFEVVRLDHWDLDGFPSDEVD